MGLLKISKYGEGLDYVCPVCSSGINKPCTEILLKIGVCSDKDSDNEVGSYIHKERYDLWANDL